MNERAVCVVIIGPLLAAAVAVGMTACHEAMLNASEIAVQKRALDDHVAETGPERAEFRQITKQIYSIDERTRGLHDRQEKFNRDLEELKWLVNKLYQGGK